MFNFTTKTSTASSVTATEEAPTESVFGTPWYIPEIEESSVIRQFKFREVPDAKTLIVVETHRGDLYEYEISTDVAEDYYSDLSAYASPGHIWNDLRTYVRDNKSVAPVEMASVSISGPADQIALIAEHAEATGLTIF
jgi:hypothetical protein